MDCPEKNGQLRVRIAPHVHQRLAAVAEKRKDRSTLSDVVRDAIEAYLKHGGENVPGTYDLEPSDAGKLLELAQQADRSPAQVLGDCVEGIHTLFKEGITPLIIMELKLRQKYYDDRSSGRVVPKS